jgi:hypothetical protein
LGGDPARGLARHPSPAASAPASFAGSRGHGLGSSAAVARGPIPSRWTRTAFPRGPLFFVRRRRPFQRNPAPLAESWTPGVPSARREARDPAPAVPSLDLFAWHAVNFPREYTPFAHLRGFLAQIPGSYRRLRAIVRRSSERSPREAVGAVGYPATFAWSRQREPHLPATFARSRQSEPHLPATFAWLGQSEAHLPGTFAW